MRSNAELLGQCLAAAGVTQVWGCAVPGLRNHSAPDEVARVLAAADGRMGPGPGAALLDDQVLLITARPGDRPDPTPVTSAALIPQIVARAADWAANDSPGAAAFRLDVELDAPAPAGLGPVAAPTRPTVDLDEVLARLDTAERPLVFVGPGVVRRGHVEALRRVADVSGLGVSNTWGAKGVFVWDSPHHLGTVALQARDFELGGFAEADVIVAVGLDHDEAPTDRWAMGADIITVPPEQLDGLAGRWRRPRVEPVPPPLMSRLSAVCMPAYGRTEVPLHPCRLIADTKASLATGDRVAADPGGAVGFWVARAFPTSELGSVVVPATVERGLAVAAAIAAAGRPSPQRVIAIVDQANPIEGELIDVATRLDVDVAVVAWGPDGEIDSVDELAPALAGLRAGGVRILRVPVDLDRLADLEAVAGPIAAWGLA